MAYAADIPTRSRVRPEAKFFYVYMATACMAVAFLGFVPTYWMPMAAGTFRANPGFHIHGMIFFSWTLYFVFQTWLAASGQIARHRAVGLIGVSLSTAMTIFGMLVAIASVRRDTALGFGDSASAFMIVPLSDIAFFALTIVLALVHTRRAEWHKRLMLLATISILPAPIARWFLTFLAPPGATGVPPVSISLGPILVSCLLIAVAMVHDWRTRGRPHLVYVAGGAALIALGLIRIPLSVTHAWQALAGAITGLPG